MEQFDARAVMAARIAQESGPDGSAGTEHEPGPPSVSAEPARGDEPKDPPPRAAARSRPS
jgi:hypothetical protein